MSDDLSSRFKRATASSTDPAPLSGILDRADVIRGRRRRAAVGLAGVLVLLVLGAVLLGTRPPAQTRVHVLGGTPAGSPSVSAAASPSPGPTPTPTPTPTKAPAGGTNPILSGVEWYGSSWLSAQEGWVQGVVPCPGGRCMVIEHTADGGTTWAPVTPPDLAPMAQPYVQVGATCEPGKCLEGHIRFVTSQTGYVFGPDLFLTTDGGHSWHQVPGLATYDLAPVGAGLVWRLAYTHSGCPGPCGWQLQQASVGSAAWTALPMPTVTAVSGQILAAQGPAVAVGFYGHIAGGGPSPASLELTADRGAHWTSRADPCGAGTGPSADAASMGPDGTLVVHCVPRGSGVAGPFVVTSSDGGAAFGPRRFLPAPPAGSTYSLVAAGDAGTVAVATGGTAGSGPVTYVLAVSQDGGTIWSVAVRDPEQARQDDPQLGYLAFTSASVGHWIGYPGTVWTTTDAGRHWAAGTP